MYPAGDISQKIWPGIILLRDAVVKSHFRTDIEEDRLTFLHKHALICCSEQRPTFLKFAEQLSFTKKESTSPDKLAGGHLDLPKYSLATIVFLLSLKGKPTYITVY